MQRQSRRPVEGLGMVCPPAGSGGGGVVASHEATEALPIDAASAECRRWSFSPSAASKSMPSPPLLFTAFAPVGAPAAVEAAARASAALLARSAEAACRSASAKEAPAWAATEAASADSFPAVALRAAASAAAFPDLHEVQGGPHKSAPRLSRLMTHQHPSGTLGL